jgi:Gluconate 2-dehydrogenase subunit 3
MQRRAAIRRISLIGGGLLLAFSGTKVYERYKSPHFQALKESRALLSALAEMILPRTDSPGAGEAGVGDLIARMVRDCADRKTQNNFINGLEMLAGRARSRYGKDFGQCSLAERTALLTECEQQGSVYAGKAGKLQKLLLGDSFFTTLKKYTILGYCTSQAGATGGLRYDYIPGKYVGSVILTPGQRGWATQ